MAKKKTDDIQLDSDSLSAKILMDLNREFGGKIANTAESILNQDNKIINVSPALDLILNGGVPEGSFVSLSGKFKTGKALSLDSQLFTENGPVLMSEAKIGMKILTPNGSSEIVGVYPQGITDLYEVKFNDNSVVLCSSDHLWEVENITRKKKILTTKNLIEAGVISCNKPRFYIKTEVAYFDNKKELPVDPYLLGVLIGDGSLTNDGVQFTKKNEEFVENIREIVNKFGYDVISKEYKYRRIIRNIKNPRDNFIAKYIKSVGLKKTSHHKFIPNDYKYSNYNNRLKLIQGLMDTDGSVSRKGVADFSTTSKTLAEDFKFLIESIGGICKISERFTNCNGKTFKSFRCNIRYSKCKDLFYFTIKKNKAVDRTKKALRRGIISITKLSNAETQCIKIKNDNGLFLTNNCITTHNTTVALTIASNAQKIGKTVYFINVEGRLKKMNLTGINGLDTSSDKFIVIGSDEDNIRSSKDFLNAVEFIVKNHPGCVIIIDSLSALVDEKQLANGAGSGMPGGGQKTVAEFVANMANVVPVKKTILIGITHKVPTIAMMMGPKSAEKVAQRWLFQTDIRLTVKYIKPLKTGEKQVGQEVNWLCECSALGPPGGTITSYIRYGVGVDAIYELMQFAINLKLISKGGAWFSLDFLSVLPEYKDGVPKLQGQENLYHALIEKPEWVQLLKKELDEFKDILVSSDSEE